jgi:hypothetical protein
VILYRMRLLLLYGVWVTVLYGAFRAVVDLTTAAGKAGYSLVNKAADMLYGTSSSDDSSAGTAAAASASVLECSAAAGGAADGSAAAASEVEGGLPAGEQAASAASSSSSSGGRNFPAGHLKDRPAAPSAFENMVSAVIPVYLMLLGSVVFFASV